MCGECREVTATQGDELVHVSVNVLFKEDGSMEIDVKECIRNILQEFLMKFKTDGKCTFPASATMFNDNTIKKLDKHKSESFHRFVAIVLFLCKRPRLDLQPIVATLCTRTKALNETDWGQLVQMMKFINTTKDDTLSLSTGEGAMCLDW